MSHARVVLVSFVVACGSGNDDDAGQPDGGSAGIVGSGSSGSNAGGSAGSSAGGSGTGSSSSGSAGSLGVPAGVLNPSLPQPSYDCRTDAQTQNCISIRGTLDGQSIDRHCALPAAPNVLLSTPDRWPVACADGASTSIGWWSQVNVPMQTPGNFSYTIAPGTMPYAAEVAVGLDDRGGDVRSSHFTGAALAGSVAQDPVTTNDLIIGTFRATWTTPAADCRNRLRTTCAAADVHGTFKVEHHLKPEDFP